MWLVRTVPMGPVVDARDMNEQLQISGALSIAFEEIAAMSPANVNRSLSKSGYRQFQLLLINMPTPFTAPTGTATTDMLNGSFGGTPVLRRELLLAVRLVPNPTGGGLKKTVESVVETLLYGNMPLSDYDLDFAKVDAALARAGLSVPSADTLRFADSWWNHGKFKGVPVLQHDDHMHFFGSMRGKRFVERYENLSACDEWPQVEGEHAITFACVSDYEFGFSPVENDVARWVPGLLVRGALAVSVRGKVEPVKITRQELRAQKKRYLQTLEEAAAKGKMRRGETEEKTRQLSELEDHYAPSGSAPPTLVDTSVIVAYNGVADDVTQLAPDSVRLNPMTNLQGAAWHEMMLCSSVAANPHLHDLPATAVAFSGVQDRTVVGDTAGALVGFTEQGRQPVYIDARGSAKRDLPPLMGVYASPGGGKTMAALWLAYQWSQMGHPTVFVDPKPGSAHDSVVYAAGGQVVSLDDFISSDGALDPLRISATPEDGITLAASMISSIDPFGPQLMRQYETEIANAINFGVKHGAKATGQALKIAVDAGELDPKIADPIFKTAQVYPMVRACFGMNPQAESLQVSDRMTLFKVGETQLDLPTPGVALTDSAPTVRHSVNLLRMIVRGSMKAMRGRGGVLQVDEAWTLQSASPTELQELGRLGRSFDVLTMVMDQTPSGSITTDLDNYLSRTLVGHLDSPREAQAAVELAKATKPDIVRRILASESLGGGAGMNFDSLRTLTQRFPDGTKNVVRGAVFYFADLEGNVAPVEVVLPKFFLEMASTNPEDARLRALKVSSLA